MALLLQLVLHNDYNYHSLKLIYLFKASLRLTRRQQSRDSASYMLKALCMSLGIQLHPFLAQV